MKIFTVRHGATKLNELGVLQGPRINEPLDAAGLEQARQAAAKIPKDISRIYCSPLLRAKQTAEEINKVLGVPISFHKELLERDFGNLSGESWDEIEKTHPGLRAKDVAQTYDYRPFNGESVNDVKARLSAIISLVKAAQKPDDQILFVTHYGIIMLMESLYTKAAPAAVPNGGLEEFEI